MSDNGPRVKKSKGLRPYLPILGLFLMIAMGAVAYVLTPIIYAPLSRSIDLPENSQLLVGVALFLGLVMLVSLIYAMFAPKPEKMVTERELAKERELRQMEQLAKRKRKREINLKQAKEYRDQQK